MSANKRNTREAFNKLIKDFDTWKEYLNEDELKIIAFWLNGETPVDIGLKIGRGAERVRQIIRGTNKFGRGGIIARLVSRKNHIVIQ